MSELASISNPLTFKYPTSNDWSPNFPDDMVEVKLYVYHNPDGMLRMVVRGADDTLMEKDVHVPAEQVDDKVGELAYWLLHSLPKELTFKWLKEQGFEFA